MCIRDSLESVGTILFPRLSRLLGVDTPSTGSYASLLRAFAQVVAESNATNKDLGEVATIATAIDRICKFVIRVASTNSGTEIANFINGGADGDVDRQDALLQIIAASAYTLSLIHISEPTRLLSISYAVFCLKKKKKKNKDNKVKNMQKRQKQNNNRDIEKRDT
eukprot:TRINITY_DN2007_c0_g1_i10.p1 TRINITY_DN2007_c0_g1~~TRINITY_DN2007_c0_g1_i10.p1  ORF type:complete len:165 (-),score=49.44 TRINITY_DN2007_c0_g1_i10:16-510(-)